jgi:hypothetical protein
MNRMHVHRLPYLPPEEPEAESPFRLLLAAVVVGIFCVAFYSLIVGLGA